MSDDFAAYVAARGQAMMRLAYLLTGSVADAEDVVQEALSRALPRWDRISQVADIDAYVRRMIVNAHVSWWRRFKRHESPSEVVHGHAEQHLRSPADSVLATMFDAALWAACAQLPRSQRVAIVLRFYEELSYRQIGVETGWPEPTARSHVHRGLANLRRLLDEEES